VSWTDANIGRVLDAFEKTQFGANDWNGTVVVLWGDHGYHLGDNDLWEKVSAVCFRAQLVLIQRVCSERAARTSRRRVLFL